MKELNDYCDVITCGVAKRPEYVKKGIPFLSSKNVKEDRFILDHYNYVSKEDYLTLTKHNKPEIGDVLYTRVGSFGEAAVVNLDFDFAIFVSLTLIKPKKNILDARYLMYYLNSPRIRDLANKSTSGIGVQNLNVNAVRKFPICIKPLTEQKAIAEKLDKAQEIIRYNEEIIAQCDALTQSLFIDMFGDPVKNEKGWEKKTLECFAKKEKNAIVDGPFGSSIKESDYIENGIPIIRINNIRNDAFFDDEYKYLSETKYNELIRSKVNFEDIIIARVGNTIGKACIFKQHFKALLSTTGVCKISINQDNYNLEFIFKQITFPTFKNYIISNVQGAGQPYLNLSKIKNFELINPPIALQNQFAERVAAIEAQKQLAQESLVKSQELFGSLLQQSFNN